MPKYRVVLKGVADNNPDGVQAFMEKFGAAYKMTPDQAKAFIQRSQGVLYNTDDQAAAEKGRAFIVKIGGVAEIQTDEPAPPPPAPIPLASQTLPASPPDGAIMGESAYVKVRKPPPPAKPSPAAGAAAIGAGARNDMAVPNFDDDFGPGPTAAPASPRDTPPGFDDDFGPAPSAAPAPPGDTPPDFDAAAPSPAAPATRPCPKCATEVSEDVDQCPACQIYIAKYEKMLARRAQQMGGAGPGGAGPGAMPTPGQPGELPYSVSSDPIKAAAAAGVLIKCSEASYALLYSLIGLGCLGLLGPVAVIYGLKALNIINNDPRFTGKEQAIAGVIIGVIETVLFGIVLFVGVRFLQNIFFQGVGIH